MRRSQIFTTATLPTLRCRLEQFRDPVTKKMLLELRGLKKDGTVGLQTVLPGSEHASKEPITFKAGHDSAPTSVTVADLIRRVHKLAAVDLLWRYWPDHGRHNTMSPWLALSPMQDGHGQRL